VIRLVPLAGAVLLTIAVEAIVYVWLLRGRRSTVVATAIAINLITVPIANTVFAAAVDGFGNFFVAFAVIELAVVVVEAPLIRALAGRGWPDAWRTSVIANACSMALSPLFWTDQIFSVQVI